MQRGVGAGFGERGVHRNDVALRSEFMEGVEDPRVSGVLQGRVADQNLKAKRRGDDGHLLAHVAVTHNTERLTIEAFGVEVVFNVEVQQRSDEVFRDGTSIAARRGAEPDPALLQISLVDVVDADGGGTHELDVAAVEEAGIDLCDAAHQQRLGAALANVGGGQLAAVEGGDGTVGAKDFAALGDVFVDEDVHGG